jgi:hypothetical protein
MPEAEKFRGNLRTASMQSSLGATRYTVVGRYRDSRRQLMGRWPDTPRATLTGFLLIFVLFPLLAWLCLWFMGR